MNIAKIVALIGFLVTTAVIIYGFVAGDFSAEGGLLISMPWGIVTLVDLYTGFFLFSGWIIYRENSLVRSIVWIVPLLTLGFGWGCIYVLVALQTSGGDWPRFWLGQRLT
ncbi:MAG: DUF1475 family protein [Chloroflexota bacterium]